MDGGELGTILVAVNQGAKLEKWFLIRGKEEG